MSKGRKPRLVALRPRMQKAEKQFQCGEKIQESGIYRVVHRSHRLPHEVTLLRDQLFPRCTKCQDSVYFELVCSPPDLPQASFKVALYAIPCVDEEEESFIIAS